MDISDRSRGHCCRSCADPAIETASSAARAALYPAHKRWLEKKRQRGVCARDRWFEGLLLGTGRATRLDCSGFRHWREGQYCGEIPECPLLNTGLLSCQIGTAFQFRLHDATLGVTTAGRIGTETDRRFRCG